MSAFDDRLVIIPAPLSVWVCLSEGQAIQPAAPMLQESARDLRVTRALLEDALENVNAKLSQP